ncbi:MULTISPECIES: desulfoferrodoxin [unclassified Archaeoglobus]|jgi:superoxide reductase|uniref:desulfoferrodoxin n=1 Tax=unclassified Archaeoglobus TaxID=2643606 RepID=UPI0025BA5CAE|nr:MULTISPECIES: desulfoferrodoxin [unclassified Archaeoglobus]
MTEVLQVYKCMVCGNVVEVVHAGRGQLVCCGQPMRLMNVKEAEEGKEKHLPVIEKSDGKVLVKVGSILHPMEEQHYIEWIELLADGFVYRKQLKPGDEPKAEFNVEAEKVSARSYCNIHGLWQVG